MRRLATALLAALAGLVAGCASTPAAEPAPPPQVVVDVEAPSALKKLLEKFLDVVRVNELGRTASLDATEWARLIDATPAQARELLQTEGYFDAKVKARREVVADGPDIVHLTVDPGPRTSVGRVDVEVQGDLERAAHDGDARAGRVLTSLIDGWKLPSGEPFRNASWSGAKADFLGDLRGAGYAAATWSGTSARVDADEHRARLFAVADSGPLFLSGPLKIEGLQLQDEETVRHIAGFGAGTPVTESLLLDFQDRLRQANLYDGIAVTFDPDPALAKATPIGVNLTEAARQVWTVGIGVSANTGPRLSVDHLNRRLFGRALTSRNKVELGHLRQAWDGEISTHPLEKQYRNLIGGTAERLKSDDDVVRSLRLRVGRAKNTTRIDRLLFVEVERADRTVFDPRSTSDQVALSVHYHGVWRYLDSNLLPTRGYVIALQTAVGRGDGTPGEPGPFGRLYGRFMYYHPLGGNWYGQARVELGQVFRRRSVPVPDSQRFRAGGDDSVRGYAYRSLGPIVDGNVDSGDALFTASIEAARPILASMPELWGAVFIDAGRAAERFSDLTPAYGYGVGVRYRSPIGPLRVDLAYGEEVKSFRVHFSVGVTF